MASTAAAGQFAWVASRTAVIQRDSDPADTTSEYDAARGDRQRRRESAWKNVGSGLFSLVELAWLHVLLDRADQTVVLCGSGNEAAAGMHQICESIVRHVIDLSKSTPGRPKKRLESLALKTCRLLRACHGVNVTVSATVRLQCDGGGGLASAGVTLWHVDAQNLASRIRSRAELPEIFKPELRESLLTAFGADSRRFGVILDEIRALASASSVDCAEPSGIVPHAAVSASERDATIAALYERAVAWLCERIDGRLRCTAGKRRRNAELFIVDLAHPDLGVWAAQVAAKSYKREPPKLPQSLLDVGSAVPLSGIPAAEMFPAAPLPKLDALWTMVAPENAPWIIVAGNEANSFTRNNVETNGGPSAEFCVPWQGPAPLRGWASLPGLWANRPGSALDSNGCTWLCEPAWRVLAIEQIVASGEPAWLLRRISACESPPLIGDSLGGSTLCSSGAMSVASEGSRATPRSTICSDLPSPSNGSGSAASDVVNLDGDAVRVEPSKEKAASCNDKPAEDPVGCEASAAALLSLSDPSTVTSESRERLLNGTDTTKKVHKRAPASRRAWLCCAWTLAGWIPSWTLRRCGELQSAAAQQAWREKAALCALIWGLNVCVLFYIVGMGMVLCPREMVLGPSELADAAASGQTVVWGFGRYYEITRLRVEHVGSGSTSGRWADAFKFDLNLGLDVSDLFYPELFPARYCPGFPVPRGGWSPMQRGRPYPLDEGRFAHSQRDDLAVLIREYAAGHVVWSAEALDAQRASAQRTLVVLRDNVYDVTALLDASAGDFMGGGVRRALMAMPGGTGAGVRSGDAAWARLWRSDQALARRALQCLNGLFYIGRVDHRRDARCVAANVVLLSSAVVLAAVVAFKFVAAVRFGTGHAPERQRRHVLMLVPCYTESETQLARTFGSLATSAYDDDRQLLLVVCDGTVVGRGNTAATPDLALGVLGGAIAQSVPLGYTAVGTGALADSRARVISGVYSVGGAHVPYVLVVKVGMPAERAEARPGNRGKRDSQVLLLRLFAKVHARERLGPLEAELHRQMTLVGSVPPEAYEFLLMVDADTDVLPDALNRLVAAMVHDSEIMGVCGETRLANERASWVTMIQVYEYFISHNLSKAFESLFGSVTCLPGCFSLYRVHSPAAVRGAPAQLVVAAPMVVDAYADPSVETLHRKNLLCLGEDRFLTTLMLKRFPRRKLQYVAHAQCRTLAPEKWRDLLSQRRRWINSTVHNLLELVFLPDLCGLCCCSMRFLVLLELVATFVQPAMVLYVVYLVVTVIHDPQNIPLLSLCLVASAYALQILLFVLKTEWQHVGWMFIYMLALPVFGFYVPLYAFWHFDDFTWGRTHRFERAAVRRVPAEMREVRCVGAPSDAPDGLSDSVLLARIRLILAEHDWNVLTKRMLRQMLSRDLGVDLEPERRRVNSLIDRAISL